MGYAPRHPASTFATKLTGVPSVPATRASDWMAANASVSTISLCEQLSLTDAIFGDFYAEILLAQNANFMLLLFFTVCVQFDSKYLYNSLDIFFTFSLILISNFYPGLSFSSCKRHLFIAIKAILRQ